MSQSLFEMYHFRLWQVGLLLIFTSFQNVSDASFYNVCVTGNTALSVAIVEPLYEKDACSEVDREAMRNRYNQLGTELGQIPANISPDDCLNDLEFVQRCCTEVRCKLGGIYTWDPG